MSDGMMQAEVLILNERSSPIWRNYWLCYTKKCDAVYRPAPAEE